MGVFLYSYKKVEPTIVTNLNYSFYKYIGTGPADEWLSNKCRFCDILMYYANSNLNDNHNNI